MRAATAHSLSYEGVLLLITGLLPAVRRDSGAALDTLRFPGLAAVVVLGFAAIVHLAA